MPAVTSVDSSEDSYVDGLLDDLKWAISSFTYSFPAKGSLYGTPYGAGENVTGFAPLNTAQQAAVQAALWMFGAVADLTFTPVSETSGQHADLRFAMSDAPSTAWAYFPTTSAEGGDAWFNRSSGLYSRPEKGNYAYLTFIHEIGHALGLEHPHESGMPQDRDSLEYTAMSYRSFIGASTTSGYTNETWGYAQSLMMYDIAAVQHLYGANYATNGGDTVYAWSPTTGEMSVNGVGQGAPGGNRILLTVWDGGGNDTYDLSGYGGDVSLDLRPGAWTTTSSAQLARLTRDGSRVAAGNIANALPYHGDLRSLIENATGGAGADTIVGNQIANALAGNAGNDTLAGGAGNDILTGGAGTDTAVFDGNRSHYAFVWNADGSVLVSDQRAGAPNGQDTAWTIELYRFADGLFAAADLKPAPEPPPPPAPEPTPGTLSTVTATGAEPVVQPVASDTTPPRLTLQGHDWSETLSGGAGDDILYGGGGNDVLIGGAGADYLSGGSGSDVASYAAAAAGIVADLAAPALNGGDARGDAYSSIGGLVGSAFRDKLSGNHASNTLTGGAGDDRLYGQGGNDVLSGGSGKDVLHGGSGRDALTGGSGSDVFVFTALSQSRGSSADTIKDFAHGRDHIDLRGIDANTKAGGNQAFSFIGVSAFSGKAGQLTFAGGVLSGDVNGDGVADFKVKLAGHPSLSKGDFYL